MNIYPIIPQDLRTTASPTFAGATFSGLTASRLVSTNGSSALASVADLTSWIAGTTNQITVTDDTDGTVTLAAAQDIHTGASPTFAGATLTGCSVLGLNSAVFQPTADATTFFQLKNAAGTAFLIGDSTNGRIGFGTTPSYRLDVLDQSSSNSQVTMARITGNRGYIDFLDDDRTGLERVILSITCNALQASYPVFSAFVSGDTYAYFGFLGDGKLNWGAGGASPWDTNLYRDSANYLKTDDNLEVAEWLYLSGAARTIRFTGTLGGGGEGIQYQDTDGTNRYALNFPGSNVVALSNRAENGVVQIRASNASGGGGANEKTLIQVEDDVVRFYNKVAFTQTDNNEYIDSLNDGYMDYGATSGHRFNANVDITGTINTTSDDNWDLNDYTAGTITDTGYVTVTINGTEYKLLARLEP